MKKIFSAIALSIALLLGGCSGADTEYRDLNQKIVMMDGQTEFSQEEFGLMLDYLDRNVEGVMTTEDMTEKLEKYPYFANFLAIIHYAEMNNDLDAENREKCAAFMAKYHGFMTSDFVEVGSGSLED